VQRVAALRSPLREQVLEDAIADLLHDAAKCWAIAVNVSISLSVRGGRRLRSCRIPASPDALASDAAVDAGPVAS
jgi:hypothetical protein